MAEDDQKDDSAHEQWENQEPNWLTAIRVVLIALLAAGTMFMIYNGVQFDSLQLSLIFGFVGIPPKYYIGILQAVASRVFGTGPKK